VIPRKGPTTCCRPAARPASAAAPWPASSSPAIKGAGPEKRLGASQVHEDRGAGSGAACRQHHPWPARRDPRRDVATLRIPPICFVLAPYVRASKVRPHGLLTRAHRPTASAVIARRLGRGSGRLVPADAGVGSGARRLWRGRYYGEHCSASLRITVNEGASASRRRRRRRQSSLSLERKQGCVSFARVLEKGPLPEGFSRSGWPMAAKCPTNLRARAHRARARTRR